MSNHYDDIVILAKGEISSSEGFMQHCFDLFPKLFSKTYDIAEEWKSNKSIAKFYIQRSSTVGQITFRLEPKIKTTRNGSILYKGQYKCNRVAVKMFSGDLTSLGENQWNLLRNIRHRNLVQLFCKAEKDNCLYIAATLGQYILFEYVEYYWNNDNPTPVQLLRQITRGLTFLHARKIVHCNLTPANILISYPNKKKERIAMIGDFELSRIGDITDVGYILRTKKLSKDWMAPEWQNADINCVSEAIDIYSLGCIYIYVLSNGKQIIGKCPIIKGQRLYVQQMSESGIAAGPGCYSELLNQMLEYSPNLRPSCSEILQYPIFWEMKRKIKFIQILTDLISVDERAESLLSSIPGNEQNGERALQIHQKLAALAIPGLNENSYRTKVVEKNTMKGSGLYGNMICSILHDLNKMGKKIQKGINVSAQELAITSIIYNFPIIVEVYYNALKELKDPSLQMFYGRETEMMQENCANCNWSNLDKRILSSILSKVPVKFYKNCHLISRKWHESEDTFYANWIRKNRAKWTASSFKNAMESNVNCKCIYWTSGDKWRMKSVPVLLKEMDIDDNIRHVSFSINGTLLAVCYRNSTKVYSSKNLSVQFSRDVEDRSYACYFNRRDSFMVMQSSTEMKVIAITAKLPVVHSVACSVPIKSPWLEEKVFLTANKEKDMTTFVLNEIPKSRNADATYYTCLILTVKGNIRCAAIIKATDGQNILFYTSGAKKLGFKVFYENSIAEIQKKPKNKIKTPDHEIDCKGTFIDYALSSSVNQKKIHVLTELLQNDYCFVIIDLVTFTMKTSILLVPYDFTAKKRVNFDCNDNYVICWSESNSAYVWELASGVCMTRLNNEDECVACAIRPRNNQLVVAVGKRDKKMKFWQLN